MLAGARVKPESVPRECTDSSGFAGPDRQYSRHAKPRSQENSRYTFPQGRCMPHPLGPDEHPHCSAMKQTVARWTMRGVLAVSGALSLREGQEPNTTSD